MQPRSLTAGFTCCLFCFRINAYIVLLLCRYVLWLPSSILSGATAIGLLIQLPAAFLLLVPSRTIRLTTAAAQFLVQLVIVVSANSSLLDLVLAALAVVLVDDAMWQHCVPPARLQAWYDAAVQRITAGTQRRTEQETLLSPRQNGGCCWTRSTTANAELFKQYLGMLWLSLRCFVDSCS